MAKEIVKYHNDLNGISTRNWTAEDMNFFFGVIARIRDKGVVNITLSTNDIRELINYDDRENRWVKVLENIADKIMGLKYIEKTDEEIAYFNMFQRFKINIPKKTIQIKVSDDFEYIVNKITGHFTRFELAEFTSLKSVYSKTMYRILKQWRTVGEKKFTIEKLRMILEVPESYTNGMLNKRIIKQIEKELSALFINFKIKTIKSNAKGNPIIAYKFTWQPEKTSNWDPNKYKNNKVPGKKQTYKKKPYRSEDGAEVAKKIANRRREQYFKKIEEERNKNQ